MAHSTTENHTCDLGAIQTLLRKFAKDRDWEQFHNPKDLTMALSIEANELLESFLWKDPSQVGIDKVKEELADVFIYALMLADKYNLKIEDIVLEKIALNANKYPVEKSKGSSRKYSEL